MLKLNSLTKILALGFLLRIFVIFLSLNINNYDLSSYRLVGQFTLSGKNIYPVIANQHHPYLPFFLYFESLAMWLTNWEINPIILLKFLFSLFDLGLVFLVYNLTDVKKAFLYAINPITILITCFQGQFDVVPVFFLILAVYLLNKNKLVAAIISYSLAILIKTWPIIFLVSFLRFSKKKRWQWLLIIFLPIISILIYGYFFHADLFVIFQTVKDYRGTYENWGIGKWIITAVFFGNEDIKNIFRKLFFLSFIVYAFVNPKKKFYESLYTQLLFFFSFTPTFGIQWLAWITPFIFITKQKKGFWLLTIMTIFLIVNYLPWIYPLINPEFLFLSNLINFLTWISFIYFFARLNNVNLRKLLSVRWQKYQGSRQRAIRGVIHRHGEH